MGYIVTAAYFTVVLSAVIMAYLFAPRKLQAEIKFYILNIGGGK